MKHIESLVVNNNSIIFRIGFEYLRRVMIDRFLILQCFKTIEYYFYTILTSLVIELILKIPLSILHRNTHQPIYLLLKLPF